MTTKEVIEIIKESKIWAMLTEKEQQEAINHALRSARHSIPEEDVQSTFGEVYLEHE